MEFKMVSFRKQTIVVRISLIFKLQHKKKLLYTQISSNWLRFASKVYFVIFILNFMLLTFFVTDFSHICQLRHYCWAQLLSDLTQFQIVQQNVRRKTGLLRKLQWLVSYVCTIGSLFRYIYIPDAPPYLGSSVSNSAFNLVNL